jgi:hypothetical protein
MAYGQLYQSNYGLGTLERGQAGSALTGTVAALADGTLWTFRAPEVSPMPGGSRMQGRRLYVERIRVQYVTIGAFTAGATPTAGRALRLVRGAPTSGTASNPSGGAAYTMVRKRSSGDETLGVGRVATTGVLTTTGITFEANPLGRVLLAASGTAGASVNRTFIFDGHEADPIYLLPGELVAVQTDSAFDAAGTFQLCVDIDAVELVGV